MECGTGGGGGNDGGGSGGGWRGACFRMVHLSSNLCIYEGHASR